MRLSGLYLYPVKSLGGFAVSCAQIDAHGLVGDRRFLVIDDTGCFLTQRSLPRMALIATALDTTHLTLSPPQFASLRVPLAPDPAAPRRTVSVWKSENLITEDCGEAPAALLSVFLGTRCRLVRLGPAFLRPIPKANVYPSDTVSFADAYPMLVIGESSLADLKDRLITRGSTALTMDRFRPNLIIADTPAYAEDTWPRFRLGEITFRAGGPCARCTVTSIDQATGLLDGPEPLQTLASYRRDTTQSTAVNFGQNLIHETKSGVLSVGDTLTLL